MKVMPDPTGPGQESVWSYPRPAVAAATQRRLKIVHRGVIIADTQKGIRTLETSHPPSYYFPPDAIAPFVLKPSRRRSFCEWKGEAIYFDVLVLGETLRDVAWSYPDPNPAFRSLHDHVAFYPGPFDGCFVDDERVTPQLENFTVGGSPLTSPARSREHRAAASGDGRVGIEKMLRMPTSILIHF